MKMLPLFAALAFTVAGCATGYHANAPGERFSVVHKGDDLWHVAFDGNSYSNRLTVQTYWLYRSAELALAQGYDGFEVVSDVGLPGQAMDPAIYLESGTDGDLHPRSYGVYKAHLEGDIRLLAKPLSGQPPAVFDAHTLKSALERFVDSTRRCDKGNVCPHNREYLNPQPAGA